MLKNSILLVALMFGLTACDNSGDSKKLPDLGDGSARASCLYPSDAGDVANMSILQTSEMQTAGFKKRYDKSWLKAVYNISGIETAKVVENTNTKIYKMSITDTGGCSFYGFLNAAPTDLEKFWNDATGGAAGGGTILGLYLPVSPKLESTRTSPVIVVREMTDRYTLVHEFMHHNFSSHATRDSGVTDDEIKAKYLEANSKLDRNERAYRASSTLENARTLATTLVEVATLYDNIMVRFTFEEMAIESILGREFDSGNLKNVAEYSYKNGGDYIRANADRYASFMKLIIKEADRLQRGLRYEHEEMMTNAKTAIYQLQSTRQTEISNIVNSLSSKRTNDSRRLSISMNGGQKPSDVHPAATGCQHSQGANEVVDKVIQDLRNKHAL